MENQEVEQPNSHSSRTRIKQLTEINEKLESELQNLKQEYARSLNVIPDLQKVYGEVNALKKSLCEYQSKNDDLQKRLDIALEANNEIVENNRNKEHPFSLAEYEKQLTDLNIEINKLKSENNFVKSQYQTQLRNYESSLYESQSETAQLQSNISKLLKAAGNYFSNNFDDIKNLTNFLNSTPQKNEIIDSKITGKDEEIQALKDKVKHLKTKYRNEKQKVKTLQIGILKIKKQTESQELQANQQITLLQDKNNQQENEIKRLILISEQKKVEEEQANSRLKNQMVQVSLTSDEARLNETFRHDLESATSLINENETTISTLRKNLEEAQNQLLQNEVEKSKLSTRLQNANSDIEDLKNQIQKQKKINEQLSSGVRRHIINENLNSKDESEHPSSLEKEQIDKDQLEKDQLEKELDDTKSKIENLLQTNKHLEQLLQGQKAEIEDLCNVKDKLITVIEQQSILYNGLEKSIEKQHNNQQPKVIEREVAIEPKFEWQFGHLPHEISDIVTQIGENDSLTIESRIKSIFTVINKYIENEQSAHQKEKDAIEQSSQDVQKDFDEYKNSIAEAFNQFEGGSNEQSINPDEAPKLINDALIKSKQMENELETLKDQNKKLFSEAGSQNFEVVFEKFKTMNDNLKRKSAQLKEEKKKRSVMRKQMSQVLSTKDKELEQKTSTLKKINENSRNQVNQLQSQLDQLTEQNKNLLHQLSSISRRKHRSKKRQINLENNENNDENNNPNAENNENHTHTEYTQFEYSQLDSTHLRYQVDDLSDQVNILNKEIAKLKQMVKDSQNETLQQKMKNEEIRKNCEEEINRAQSACRTEKAQLQNTIDDLSGKLLVEAKNHREVLKNVNDSLSEKEKQLDKVNQELMNLKFELDKVQMNADSKVEASERSRKLSECQYKAKILSIESQHAIDLEEQKKNDEKEKRDLIQYFIKNFSTFSDMHDQLDEDAFKETVRKVKNQFDKCQKRETAIRKLIKAKDKESTDDALTQFIIRMHPQFQSLK